VALLVGLAVAVAAGVSLVLWSQTPNYSVVSAGLAERDTSDVMTTLEGAGITNKLDDSGQVLVPRADLASARATLAEAGLMNSGGYGCFELPEAPMGQSPGMESVLLTRCLETDLARTITGIRGVTTARVHLALPPRSVFVRDQAAASASVHVSVAPGSVIRNEIASVPYLVADAVPGLTPDRVTVIDQNGVMLTTPEGVGNGSGLSSSQFEFRQEVEADLANDIVAILSPIVGLESVRAKVTAKLDFTMVTEETTTYDPNGSVLKSEATSASESQGTSSGPQGVPGAISNQPPETVDQTAAGAQTAPPPVVNRTTSQDTDNEYANSSTRRVSQLPTGEISSLSVAVLLDSNKAAAADGGGPGAYSAEQLAEFTQLAQNAVGFDAERGDIFAISSFAFEPPPTFVLPPEPGLMEQAWIWEVARQGVGALMVLILAFVVVRPIMRNLTKPPAPDPMLLAAGGGAGPGQLNAGALPGVAQIPSSYDDRVAAARGLVGQDPRQVAQVVRNWVADDDG
jgi:flagellar M-ring protein FliF